LGQSECVIQVEARRNADGSSWFYAVEQQGWRGREGISDSFTSNTFHLFFFLLEWLFY
jgi:hypothetical protein